MTTRPTSWRGRAVPGISSHLADASIASPRLRSKHQVLRGWEVVPAVFLPPTPDAEHDAPPERTVSGMMPPSLTVVTARITAARVLAHRVRWHHHLGLINRVIGEYGDIPIIIASEQPRPLQRLPRMNGRMGVLMR